MSLNERAICRVRRDDNARSNYGTGLGLNAQIHRRPVTKRIFGKTGKTPT